MKALKKGLKKRFRMWRKRTDDPSSISIPSLNDGMACLLRVNDEAAREISMFSEATWKNDQLYAIVVEFLDLSYKTLCFLYDMRGCLKAFRDGSLPETNVAEAGRLVQQVLLSFEKVIAAHGFMLKKLGQLKSSKSKRIQLLFRRRKIIHAILLTVFVGAVVCSSIVAAVHAPPLLAALPAAAVTISTFGPLTSWVENFWKEEEDDIGAHLEAVNVMSLSSSVLMHELHGIEISVGALMDQKTRSVSNNACMKFRGSGHLIGKIDELDEQLSQCCQGIEMARKQLLDKLNTWTERAEMEGGSPRSETSSSSCCCCCIPFWCCM